MKHSSTPNWSEADKAKLIRLYEQSRIDKICIRDFCRQAGIKLHHTAKSCEKEIRESNVGAIKNHWKPEELELLKIANAKNIPLSAEQIKEIHNKIPRRSIKAIRDKMQTMDIKLIDNRFTKYQPKPKSSKVIPQMIGTECNIYDKAAILIGGEYKGGQLYYKDGTPLLASETLKFLAKVRW